MRPLVLTALALVALAAGTRDAAAASEQCGVAPTARLTLCDLEVAGGDRWHAEDSFALSWRNPPADAGPALAAVRYRVLNPAMQVVMEEKRVNGPVDQLEQVQVPAASGMYIVEIRLEDAAGNLGPPATAELRFDDRRPGDVEPLPASDWIGRPDFPFPVRLAHPAGPPPLSGIRGYAVVVDRSPDGNPCGGANRCSELETSLHGGVEEDTLWLAHLPEGTGHVHAVAVSGSGMRSAHPGRTTLRVDTTDPETTLAGVPSGWANRPVTLVAQASDVASGMAAAGAAGPFTAIRIDGGAPISAFGDSVQARVIAAGVHTVAHYARDAAGNVDDGHGGSPDPATATVRIDPIPPRVAFSTVQDRSEPELIEARVLDSLSAPSRSRGRIAVRRAGSGERFEPLPTRVGDGWLQARWDSEAYPPGQFEFEATGFDRAGNAASTVLRESGSRMVLSAPLKGLTELRARVEQRRSPGAARHSAAFLEGRLISGRNTPLAGMAIRVLERFAPGAGWRERVSMTKTDDHGRFALRLGPGPSREVVASFAGTPTLGRTQSDALRLGVRTRVLMRASAPVARVGGPPVVFRGRVAGEVPPEGKYVQLQFRLPGLAWGEFRTVRSDSRGHFRYAYRFSDDDSRGVRFQFRAYAAAQDDWPYEPGGSRPVVVRGR